MKMEIQKKIWNPIKPVIFQGVRTPIPPLDPHMNRGAVKTDRNRSLNMRTDKRAYAEF